MFIIKPAPSLKWNKKSIFRNSFIKCCFCVLILSCFSLPSYSQDKMKHSSWWVGLAGGANFNRYKGYTSALNVDIKASPAFGKGHGIGGYAAALIEYRQEGAWWGLRLQQGADSRKGTFKKNGNRLTTEIGYYSIEPAILISPMRSHFYLFAGPSLRLLWSTAFTYQEPNGPEYPQKNVNYPAYVKNLEKVKASLHVGIGYDLSCSKFSGKTDVVISPFITYLPSLGQNLRTIENLELNTLRAGIILKVGLNPERK